MSFCVLNYEYFINNYTTSTYSLSEFKTQSIVNKEGCNIINTIREKTQLDRIEFDKTTQSRSCDLFDTVMVETDLNIDVKIDDPTNELFFELEYGDIKISSFDLIKFISIFGSKLLQKNYDHGKVFTHLRNTGIIDLYDRDKIETVLLDVFEILKKSFPCEGKLTPYEYDKLYKMSFDGYKMSDDFLTNIEQYMLNIDKLKYKINHFTYAKYFKPKKNSKMVMLGDLHGSLSTFVRHLLRWKKLKILDSKGKIHEDYYIVFIGDIVDRGIYGYEMLCIIYLLFLLNPDQVIINKGNHEETRVNCRINRGIYEDNLYYENNTFLGNLGNELLGKFPSFTNYLKISTHLANISLYQHSSVICENPNNNKFIYISHGCLPHELDNGNKLNNCFLEQIKLRKSFAVDEDIGMGMRWNDFYGCCGSLRSKRSFDTNNTIKLLGTDILKEANNNGIEFVIRGHEDLTYNFKVMEENDKYWETINDGENMQCDGMTHIIKLSNGYLNINDQQTKYLPIITISTNTDLGKNIVSDGYIIVDFDLNNKHFLSCSIHPAKGGKFKFNKYLFK